MKKKSSQWHSSGGYCTKCNFQVLSCDVTSHQDTTQSQHLAEMEQKRQNTPSCVVPSSAIYKPVSHFHMNVSISNKYQHSFFDCCLFYKSCHQTAQGNDLSVAFFFRIKVGMQDRIKCQSLTSKGGN